MYILDFKTGCDLFILMEEPSEGLAYQIKVSTIRRTSKSLQYLVEVHSFCVQHNLCYEANKSLVNGLSYSRDFTPFSGNIIGNESIC